MIQYELLTAFADFSCYSFFAIVEVIRCKISALYQLEVNLNSLTWQSEQKNNTLQCYNQSLRYNCLRTSATRPSTFAATRKLPPECVCKIQNI